MLQMHRSEYSQCLHKGWGGVGLLGWGVPMAEIVRNVSGRRKFGNEMIFGKEFLQIKDERLFKGCYRVYTLRHDILQQGTLCRVCHHAHAIFQKCLHPTQERYLIRPPQKPCQSMKKFQYYVHIYILDVISILWIYLFWMSYPEHGYIYIYIFQIFVIRVPMLQVDRSEY